VSIAGMDGAEMGKYVYPALTTLNNDPAEWGVAAAGALLDLIEHGTADDVVLPGARLIVRESTSPPA
jgi:DNA-binding LacI/PurR family transcriptional regulator